MLKKAAAFFVLFFVFTAASHVVALSAEAYAMVEQISGRLITGQNENKELPMASTTKIMTALIACESGKLDTTVTVNGDAIKVEGTSMGLLAGEHITLRDLVYGLMLKSGNDAANAIAYYLGGSIGGFVEMMNGKAAELGLSDTHFLNPSGLYEDGHYTTALDLARLGAAAMKNPDFANIVGTEKIKVTYNGIANGRTLINHNRLLRTYDGMTGIKTGYTKKCGRCLVTSATRDGVSLVVATLDDPNDWDDHIELLNVGFKKLKSYTLFDGPITVSEKVVGGYSDTVTARFSGSITAALEENEISNVTMEIIMPSFIYAPVQEGQVIGQVVFKLGNDTVAETDLLADSDVSSQQTQIKGIATILVVLILIILAAAVIKLHRRWHSVKVINVPVCKQRILREKNYWLKILNGFKNISRIAEKLPVGRLKN